MSNNIIGSEIIAMSWYGIGPKQEARLSDDNSDKYQKGIVTRSKQSPKRSVWEQADNFYKMCRSAKSLKTASLKGNPDDTMKKSN